MHRFQRNMPRICRKKNFYGTFASSQRSSQSSLATTVKRSLADGDQWEWARQCSCPYTRSGQPPGENSADSLGTIFGSAETAASTLVYDNEQCPDNGIASDFCMPISHWAALYRRQCANNCAKRLPFIRPFGRIQTAFLVSIIVERESARNPNHR